MADTSSTRKEIQDLLAEIQRVDGWTVTRMGTHYQVKNPDGATATVSGTPSSQRTIDRIKKDLRDIGWDPTERARIRKTDAERALEEDRAKNEAAIAKAAAEADRRYAEEHRKLRGQLRPGSPIPGTSPVQYKGFERVVKVVTPFEAQVELKRQERAQCVKRKVKLGNERDLRSAMAHGKFKFTPENPVFDEHGCLVQGHHRYRSIADSDPEVLEKQYGYPGILLEIVVNAPAEINSVYDTGVSRSPADVLTLNGVVKNENAVSAAIGILMAYDRDNTTPWVQYNRVRVTRDERLSAFEETYASIVDKPMEDALVLSKPPISMTMSVALAFSFIVHRDLPELDKPYDEVRPTGETFSTTRWAQFRMSLLTGSDLKYGNPILPFRDYLMSDDRTKYTNNRLVQFYAALKVMDYWRQSKELKILKVLESEKIARFK